MNIDEYSVHDDHALVSGFLSNSFVINLDKDEEKLAKTRELFEQYGLSFSRFPGIDGQGYMDHLKVKPQEHPEFAYMKAHGIHIPGSIGCTRAHRGVINLAKMQGYPWVAVFEDDVTFKEDFLFVMARAIEALPDDWDALQIGGVVGASDFGWNKPGGSVEPINQWLAKGVRIGGGQSYVIRDTIYDQLLEAWKPWYAANDDTWFIVQENSNWLCLRYWVTGQRYSYSELRQRARQMPNNRKAWSYEKDD